MTLQGYFSGFDIVLDHKGPLLCCIKAPHQAVLTAGPTKSPSLRLPWEGPEELMKHIALRHQRAQEGEL